MLPFFIVVTFGYSVELRVDVVEVSSLSVLLEELSIG